MLNATCNADAHDALSTTEIPGAEFEVPQTSADDQEKTRAATENPWSSDDSDEALQDDKDEADYPEGGLRAWLVVLGSWCALTASLGIMNTLGTFQTYISSNQLADYSDGTIGWIFSLYTFLAWFCGIYVGPLFDKYGPRWLILAGSACVVSSMMLLGICSAYWHFILVFGLLGGIGAALLFTPSIAAVAHYFKARRGNATGIAATGGSVGGIMFPLMMEKLNTSLGFAWSTRIVGFICLFLCIIANILISSRLPPNKNASANPDFRIFRNVTFLLTTVACFCMEWGMFVPMTYISSYAISKGFGQALGYEILPILNVASVFGRWLPGFYCDRIGRYNTAILAVILNVIAVFCIWLPAGSTEAGLVIFALVAGFAMGSNVSIVPVCIGQLCKTDEYGRYYATCYTVVSVGCLTGIPIAGEILESDGGRYWGLIIFVGFIYTGACLFFAAARVKEVGWKLTAIY